MYHYIITLTDTDEDVVCTYGIRANSLVQAAVIANNEAKTDWVNTRVSSIVEYGKVI